MYAYTLSDLLKKSPISKQTTIISLATKETYLAISFAVARRFPDLEAATRRGNKLLLPAKSKELGRGLRVGGAAHSCRPGSVSNASPSKMLATCPDRETVVTVGPRCGDNAPCRQAP